MFVDDLVCLVFNISSAGYKHRLQCTYVVNFHCITLHILFHHVVMLYHVSFHYIKILDLHSCINNSFIHSFVTTHCIVYNYISKRYIRKCCFTSCIFNYIYQILNAGNTELRNEQSHTDTFHSSKMCISCNSCDILLCLCANICSVVWRVEMMLWQT